jgi:hypothetical protein
LEGWCRGAEEAGAVSSRALMWWFSRKIAENSNSGKCSAKITKFREEQRYFPEFRFFVF